MYALIVHVEVDASRSEEATQALHGMVVPQAKGSPGFVSGTWGRSADGTRGYGTVLFESEETAAAAAQQARDNQREGVPVTLVSADVYEVLAQA